jgi:hypothetical protein
MPMRPPKGFVAFWPALIGIEITINVPIRLTRLKLVPFAWEPPLPSSFSVAFSKSVSHEVNYKKKKKKDYYLYYTSKEPKKKKNRAADWQETNPHRNWLSSLLWLLV